MPPRPNMNPHLVEQLRRYLPEIDPDAEPWKTFLAVVSDAYDMKDSVASADRAKSEFLAVVSHEMRTPLNAILGFAQLLRDSPLGPEQRSWLQTIHSNGESLCAIIDDIVDYSRIEAGGLDLKEEAVVMGELLDSVVSMFRPRASEKGLELKLEISDDVPNAILTDGSRLRQILVNLINNAVKFTHDGSIVVQAQLKSQQEDGRLELLFQVHDTGIGIKAEHRERLFRPFSQGDTSTTRLYGGTGLGLAICRRLSRALGGEIDFRSSHGEGSSFFFTITTRRAPRPRAARRTITAAK